MYFIYILKSIKDNSHYIGITNDLKRRLNAHNAGHSRFTKLKRPYKLIWYCVFSNKTKALKFEKYLKTGSGIAFSRKRLI